MPTDSRRWTILALFGMFLALILLVDWRDGTFQSDFGRNPDEGIHYVTGVMIRSFFASPAAWAHPMAFARDFYAHYPKIGLGQWPPLFELWQAIWSLLFGLSRTSLLFGMAILTASLATLVARTILDAIPGSVFFGVLAGVLLILAPLTQEYSSMTMAEVPLALISFASVLAWIRFESSGTWRSAVVFGCLTAAAILTKGNAWLIPPVVIAAIAANASWRVLRKAPFWIGASIIALLCVPFTLLTINIVRQGMNTPTLPTAAMIASSLRAHIAYVIDVFGIPLFSLALIGAAATWRRNRPTESAGPAIPFGFWRTMTIYGAGIVAFHAIVPTSFEPRKIYQIVPVLALLIVAGAHAVWRSMQSSLRRSSAASLLPGVAVLILFLFSGFHWIMPFQPGVRAVIGELGRHPDARRAAVLISSNAYYQDLEAAFIAEWLSQNGPDGTYLLRATKILSRVGTDEHGEPSVVPAIESPGEALDVLSRVPVSYVVVHTVAAPRGYAHHVMLQTALANATQDWEASYRLAQVTGGLVHETTLFKNRHDVRGQPIHFEIDLTRKIRQSITVDSGQGVNHP